MAANTPKIDPRTAFGIAERTVHNLQIIRAASQLNDPKAHWVTQIVLSTLGVLVMPLEDLKNEKLLKRIDGAPWVIKNKCTKTTTTFLEHVRNAIAHGRVEIFDTKFPGVPSKSRIPKEVTLRLTDADFGKKEICWMAEITANELEDLVVELRNLLHEMSL